ncbi:copper resistance protein CopC [Micromonospora musae]|uniref:Copper resistance protein CopC n=2 Tax=Micromonospora musae TaxID=1894970 RepID=A0ABX9RF66_9ACTN|nr:copper resistance protein CopC [Micromonospora musae]
MMPLPPALRRIVSGLLALVLAAAIAVLASAPPAAAHGTLATATPADGSAVSRPPAEVRLYFTERVAANAYFTITAPGGGRVDDGWTNGEPKPLEQPVREYFLVDGKFEPREYSTGFPAVVRIAHLPRPGQYSISYLTVASDGDTVRGATTFRYTGATTAAPRGWQPPTDQPDPALIAATEQHGNPGTGSATPQSPSAAPAVASSPPPAAAAADRADDEGGLGWMAWTGSAVAAVALILLAVWRHRTAGRARAAGAAARRGTGARARAGSSARAQAGGGAGRRTGTGAKVTKPASGNRGRPAAVPAARRGGTTVTATTGSAVPRQRKAGATTESYPRTATGSAVPRQRGAGATTESGPRTATGSVVPRQQGAGPATDDDPRPATGPGGSPEGAAAAATLRPRLSNARLALLVGGLVVALVAGFGLGRVGAGDPRTGADARAGTSPAGAPVVAGQAMSAMDGHQHPAGTGPHSHPGDGGAGQTQVSGTTVSAGGYRLQPEQRSQPAGVAAEYRFQIIGADRRAATRFAVVHEKTLHLIVVGRDLTGYQHLHPTMAADGTWSIPLTLPRAGGYRVYADFSVTTAAGTQLPLVLGVDHQVPGAHTPTALPPPQPQATAGPFTVSMDGTPTVGMMSPTSFRITRAGTPAPVERYLGAYGHLVVVREGDLGYVHVHPEPELVDGAVKFWLTPPSPGRYRAFLDFQVDGAVHTAQYTIDVG